MRSDGTAKSEGYSQFFTDAATSSDPSSPEAVLPKRRRLQKHSQGGKLFDGPRGDCGGWQGLQDLDPGRLLQSAGRVECRCMQLLSIICITSFPCRTEELVKSASLTAYMSDLSSMWTYTWTCERCGSAVSERFRQVLVRPLCHASFPARVRDAAKRRPRSAKPPSV